MHTLLIVEDEKMIRQGIKAMVQRSGVPVDVILECSNGEMALEILKSQPVDVMFTDIRMPKMDGIELVRSMQSLPEKPLTVAVSGYDEFSYAVEMLRAGIKEYILKPVDRDQIKEILERLEDELQQRQERTENTRTISCQQLKHLIQDSHITEAEQEAVLREYDYGFYKEGYVVCCLDDRQGEPVIEEDYIYINHLGDHEIYIMKTDVLEQFRLQEWRRRYVGISSTVQGLENLRQAFGEAVQARKKAFWTEKPLVIFEEKTDSETVSPRDTAMCGDTCRPRFETPDHYVQMIGTDKSEQALKQLGNLLWNTRRSEDYDMTETVISDFLDKLPETYESVLHTETERVEGMKHLYAYPCVSDYESEFIGWLGHFAENLNRQFEDYKNKQKVREAVTYIRENYDKDLNMAVVSNHISMNYSLFSFAFKQYTGTNFVNYLKEIRMEKAKELLGKTDLRIVEISRKVGYENEKHFMKIFKASCGVSPTEYRRNTQYRGE